MIGGETEPYCWQRWQFEASDSPKLLLGPHRTVVAVVIQLTDSTDRAAYGGNPPPLSPDNAMRTQLVKPAIVSGDLEWVPANGISED